MHLAEFRRPSLPYSLRPFAGGILATSILAASMNAAWAATFRPVLQPKSGTDPGDASEVVFSESVSGDAAEVFKPWLDTVWDGEWLMTTSLKVKDGASVVIGRADEIYAVCADHIVVADGASLTFLGVPTVMGLNGALSLTLKNASLILSARQADPEVPLGGVLTVDGPVLVSGTSRVLLEGLGVEVPGVTPLTPTVVLEWRPEKLTFADGTSRLEIKVGSNSVLLLGAQNPATVAEGIPLKGMLVVGGELTLDPRVSYLVGDLTDMRPGVNFYVGSGGVLVFEGAEILGRTSSGAMLIAPEGTKIQFAPGSVLWVGADADSADMKDAAEKFDFEGAEVYGLEVLTVRGGHEEGHFTPNRDGSIGFVVGKRTFSGDFAGTLENIDLQSASRWLRSYYISAASDDISSGLEQLALVPATAGGAESMLKSTALPVDVLARWLDPARIPEVAPGGDGVVIEFPPVLRRIPVEVTVGTVEGGRQGLRRKHLRGRIHRHHGRVREVRRRLPRGRLAHRVSVRRQERRGKASRARGRQNGAFDPGGSSLGGEALRSRDGSGGLRLGRDRRENGHRRGGRPRSREGVGIHVDGGGHPAQQPRRRNLGLCGLPGGVAGRRRHRLQHAGRDRHEDDHGREDHRGPLGGVHGERRVCVRLLVVILAAGGGGALLEPLGRSALGDEAHGHEQRHGVAGLGRHTGGLLGRTRLRGGGGRDPPVAYERSVGDGLDPEGRPHAEHLVGCAPHLVSFLLTRRASKAGEGRPVGGSVLSGFSRGAPRRAFSFLRIT